MPYMLLQQAVQSATTATIPADLSLWNLFIKADIIVQAVMLLLLAFSLISWGIIFEKWSKFNTLFRRASQFESVFWATESLDGLYEKVKKRVNHPFAYVFISAMEEWHRAGQTGNSVANKAALARPGVRDRIAQIMRVAQNREIEELEKGLGFLATVGSASPFIGLFGTVWGIMNSFQSIAASKNTSLAVVAPGIAEALFATAIGLLAAIPAVMAYNRFNSQLNKYAGQLDDFSAEFQALLSRQSEQAAMGRAA